MFTYLKNLIFNSPAKHITYAEYIEAVLYHPDLGYYMKEKQKIGRKGDFITSSNISDVFGRTIANWFAFICEKYKLNPVFCEVGAGNGRFAKAFLDEWNDKIKTPLTYLIVESSPYHEKLQRELLKDDFSYVQADTLDKYEPFEGMIFSNELFDALPVHVIEKKEGRLYEIMVGIHHDELSEEWVPLSDQNIIQFLKENKLELNEGQRLEIPLMMEDMLKAMSEILVKGFVTTVDYGYSNSEWLEPSREKGSLRGYFQHQLIDNALMHPGDMDITTHIFFDWLIKKGEQLQLEFVTKLRQDEFLVKTGILKELENHYDPNPFSDISKRNRSIRSLIMPSGMSSSFHAIIQQKGMNVKQEQLFPE